MAVRVVARDIGRFKFKGVQSSYRLIEMMPAALQKRKQHTPSRPPAGKWNMLRNGKGQVGEYTVNLPNAQALVEEYSVGMEQVDRVVTLGVKSRFSP